MQNIACCFYFKNNMWLIRHQCFIILNKHNLENKFLCHFDFNVILIKLSSHLELGIKNDHIKTILCNSFEI